MEERVVEHFENWNNLKTRFHPRVLPCMKVRRVGPLVLFVTVVG
jgi:hypothetical protein